MVNSCLTSPNFGKEKEIRVSILYNISENNHNWTSGSARLEMVFVKINNLEWAVSFSSSKKF